MKGAGRLGAGLEGRIGLKDFIHEVQKNSKEFGVVRKRESLFEVRVDKITVFDSH